MSMKIAVRVPFDWAHPTYLFTTTWGHQEMRHAGIPLDAVPQVLDAEDRSGGYQMYGGHDRECYPMSPLFPSIDDLAQWCADSGILHSRFTYGEKIWRRILTGEDHAIDLVTGEITWGK